MTKIRLPVIRPFALLTILWLVVSTTVLPAVAQASDNAQAAMTSTALVATTGNDLTITWPNPALVSASAADLLQQLPTVRYQGYELPMQLITVEIDADQPLNLQFGDLRAQPWQQPIPPAAALAPNAIEWETLADPTQPAETVALPTAPLFVLRQGVLHGKMIAVIALSPLYAEAGVTQVATAFSARVAGARTANTQSLTQSFGTEAETLANLRAARANTALDPVNADAVRKALKVLVSESGMQQMTGQMLASAGFDLNVLDPARLQLRQQGEEIALQIDGVTNGRLTATSTLRFYTPQVGDRWNLQEIYWLTERESAGLRMTTRAVPPGAAQSRSTVVETGVWEDYKLYDSRYAGADNDHWFHQALSVGQASAVTAAATVAATVTPHLPRIADTAIYTLSVTTNIRGQHTLRVKSGNQEQDVAWHSVATNVLVRDWQHVVSGTDPSNSLTIGLLGTTPPPTSESIVLLDKIAWQVPVVLNFVGGGAEFHGLDGTWRYQWSNIPAGYAFYDVTESKTPILLTGADASGFQDGPTVRTYLVTGLATLHTPTVVAHFSLALPPTSGADAIYIGPAPFLSELEPLLQLRREQGYLVTTVDVQAIYDAWSYGAVSAEAIRTFLRYAAATWQRTPQAVTLVGDGTVDPHNYEGKNNLNFVPPYLANVDPWLIEAACEPCYVQLDGDNPVTGDDPAGHFFAADLWLGRLPVKNSGELAALITKIVSYERATSIEAWQNVSVFIADNHIKSLDSNGLPVKDLAGDFSKIADGLAALTPAGIRNQRIYYDPYPQFSDPSGTETWRIADAAQAHRAVLAQLSAGAGIISYNGHSHHWQWAITDESPNADPNSLLSLYDTDLLTNKDRYFIGLSMTCLTAQFQKPAFSGTVLDERMLLNPNGGATAIWGPAGLSVAYGHDLLERGFYNALWAAPPLTARMGALIEAGNIELLTQGACCQDTLKTFLLLGDPLMKVRVYPAAVPQLYLPIVSR